MNSYFLRRRMWLLQLERQRKLQLLSLFERQRGHRALDIFDILQNRHCRLHIFHMMPRHSHLHRTEGFERLHPPLVHQVAMATAQELSTTPALLPLLVVLELGMTAMTTCSATRSTAFLKERVTTSVARKSCLMVDRTYFTRGGAEIRRPQEIACCGLCVGIRGGTSTGMGDGCCLPLQSKGWNVWLLFDVVASLRLDHGSGAWSLARSWVTHCYCCVSFLKGLSKGSIFVLGLKRNDRARHRGAGAC
jgi:hypothetical protein